MSLDLFITKDLPHVSREDQESIEHYNGPFFEDDGDDRWIYRVATTVFEEDDGVGMATEVLRLDRDAESWETWYDGKWRRNGPPAHIFEVIAMETVKEMVEEISGAPVPEIYDDDDEDWENSIESLMVTPGIIAALGRAGIETIEQLTNMTEREVLAIKGIGKKALEDIKDALDFEDLTLREVHHAVSDDIKLRAVVTRWSQSQRINSVIGFSGTPYLEKAEKISVAEKLSVATAEIMNIVYYYPLIDGIGNFLKRPKVKIAEVAESPVIIEKGVREFLDTYGETIYCTTIINLRCSMYCV